MVGSAAHSRDDVVELATTLSSASPYFPKSWRDRLVTSRLRRRFARTLDAQDPTFVRDAISAMTLAIRSCGFLVPADRVKRRYGDATEAYREDPVAAGYWSLRCFLDDVAPDVPPDLVALHALVELRDGLSARYPSFGELAYTGDPMSVREMVQHVYEKARSDFRTMLLAPSTAAARAAAAEALALHDTLAGRGDRSLVARAEREVSDDPGRSFLARPDGTFRLECAAGSWAAGRFTTPSIRELEAELDAGSGRLRFFVLVGASPLTDIGWLQATAPPRCFFQVASQFNCLEAPGPTLVPVSHYFSDPTHGPRAAVGAFPGALLRHYFAPDGSGGRFTQETAGRQIDLLAGALEETGVSNGYLTGHGLADPAAWAEALEVQWLDLRVGVHEELEVALGGDWDGGLPAGPRPPVGQVLTSTVAGGAYGAERQLGAAPFRAAARQLLRAAYYGTLAAAARARAEWVCLTLIGGGVFANPVDLVFDSIVWAMDRIEPRLGRDLNVVLNGRDLHRRMSLEDVVLPEVRRRSGLILTLDEGGVVGRTT